MSDEKWDAIVIGSGLGGLTTAAYLSTNGLRTQVLEQYDTAGGSSHVFRRNNKWEFDVGVHYIGDCGPNGLVPTVLRGIGLEGKIDFLPMDEEFFTLISPDLTFKVPKGWDNYLNRAIEAFPDEEAGLRKHAKVMRNIAKELNRADTPNSLLDAVKFALKSPTVIRWSRRSSGDLFDSCKLSDQARWFLAAGSTIVSTVPPSRVSVLLDAMAIDHMLKDGGFYPKGGGQVFAANLVDVVRTHGGDVRTQARVEKILIQDGSTYGVRLNNGEVVNAPVIVSAADIKKTFLDFVGAEYLSARTIGKVSGYRMALPLFCVYLGLDIDLSDRMPNTNYMIYTSYDIEAICRDCYEGRIPDDPLIYITVASIKDPHTEAIAPRGSSNIQIMTLVPPDYSLWHIEEGPAAGEKYSRKSEYLAIKESLTERLIESAEKVIPDVKEHIVWKEASTPITHERYTLASGGTSYGIEPSTGQFGLKRPKPKTEVEGLYLAGASTVFGSGVVGTMLGGIGCASAILRRNLLEEIRGGRVYGDPSKLTPRGPDWDPLLVSRSLSKKYKGKDVKVAVTAASEHEVKAA